MEHVMMGTKRAQRSWWTQVRQAFSKFLGVPLGIVGVFLLIGILLTLLERAEIAWVESLRAFLRQMLFSQSDTTGAFLGVVSGGWITMTSITISMLLLALQQTASNMGNMIYDQFVARRRNQVYVGFIVGGSVLVVFLRGTVTEDFNPVLGATFALLVTVLSLVALLFFLYTMMNQMRPSTVVHAIYERTQGARKRQLHLVGRTRREARSKAPVRALLHASYSGYVTSIDLNTMSECLADEPADVELIIKARVGAYVSYDDPLVEVKARESQDARRLAQCIGDAYGLKNRRQFVDDPGYGLEQLHMIAWAEVSTAKDNPETGLMVIRAVRDLVSRWILHPPDVEIEKQPLPVVYEDTVLTDAFDVLEAVAVVSSESLQYQNFAEMLRAVAVLYPRLPGDLRSYADGVLRRTVSAMGDHVMTQSLERALEKVTDALRKAGSYETAGMLDEAGKKLAESKGQLANRSTRVKGGA